MFLHVVVRGLLLIFHSENAEIKNNQIGVSVIIAARNEFENLKKLLPALKDQEYSNFEIIICLDRCSDESLDYMKSIESDFENLKLVLIDYLPDHFSPKKYALTLGIKKAKYDWILLTDADCLPNSNNWISSFAAYMDDNVDFILGFSPYRKLIGILNNYIRFETFSTAYEYLSSVLLKIPYMGVGRNMAYKKEVFLNNLGFGRFQGIMGGDDDLFVNHHAKGERTRIVLGSDSLTYSEPKISFSTYKRQKLRHFSVSKYYRNFSKLILSSEWAMTLILWLTFIILALNKENLIWAAPLFIGYLGFKILLNYLVSKKMGDGYSFVLLPLLEFIHIVFVPLFVTISTATNKIKWK